MLKFKAGMKARIRARLKAGLVAGFLLILVSGCASQKPHIDYDPEANFTSYTTFAWADEDQAILFRDTRDRQVSALNLRRIKAAIEYELIANGYVQVEKPEDASFLIGYTVGVRDMIDADRFHAYPRSRWVQHWPYRRTSIDIELDFHTYTEGMLAIDIYEGETMLPVWHGVERKRITGADIKDSKTAIETAVRSILSGFPPTDDE